MRTAYIHIGTHKTGTTSIQWGLMNHREELQRKGFLYPRTGIPPDLAGHHNIARELSGSPGFCAERGGIEDLLREINESRCDVVLSSETFSIVAQNPQKFASFVAQVKGATGRVVLVLYLRNQVGYARSLYFELLRHGYRQTFESFLEVVVNDRMVHLAEHARYAFCYRDLLTKLPAGAGIETVVRLYDRTVSGGVTSDFLSALGLTLDDLGAEAEMRANPSLSLAQAVLEFYRNRRGEEPSARLIDFVQRAFADRRADLTASSRRRIVSAFDESNQFVNARYPSCALACRATESPRPASDDLFMENIFSESTVILLDAVADLCVETSELARARDDAAFAHGSAVFHFNLAVSQRDEFAKQHAAAVAEMSELARARDDAASAHASALYHLDLAVSQRDALAVKHDAAVAERDMLVNERSDLLRKCDLLSAERTALARALADVVADRDTMLRSRSWRLTAPLRRLYGHLRSR